MANKKRSKSGDRDKGGVGRFSPSAHKWESGLISDSLNEDGWSLTTSLLVPSSGEDYPHLDALGEWVRTGKPIRKLFTTITMEEIVKMVNEMGGKGAGKKPKEMPAHFEVCEVAKQYLDAGEEIPLPLLARVIKFRLLAIKAADKLRRENEQKGTEDPKKGKKAGGGEKKGGDKAKRGGSGVKEKKKGGGAAADETPSAKEGTKLRKRGEEDLENKYLDDEPDDGAQQYVLLHGFHFPYILPLLNDVGVPLDCVLEIRSQSLPAKSEDRAPFGSGEATVRTTASGEAATARTEAEETVTLPASGMSTERGTAGGVPASAPATERSEVAAPTSAGSSGTKQNRAQLEAAAEQRRLIEKADKELRVFWRDLRLLLALQPPKSKLYDTALLQYDLKTFILQNPDIEDPTQRKTQFLMETFEDVAVKLYDLLDLKRQWRNYMSNLRLYRIAQLTHDKDAVQPTSAGGNVRASGLPASIPEGTAAGTTAIGGLTQAGAQASVAVAGNIGGPTGAPLETAPTEAGAAGEQSAAAGGELAAEGSAEQAVGPRVLSAAPDMRYYNDLLSFVPPESTSVELQLYALVEQVCASESGRAPISEAAAPTTAEGLSQTIQNYLDHQTSKLPPTPRKGEELSFASSRGPSLLATGGSALVGSEFVHPLDASAHRTRGLEQNAAVGTVLPSLGMSAAPTSLSLAAGVPLGPAREATRAVFAHAQPCNFFDARAAELHMLRLAEPFRSAARKLQRTLDTDEVYAQPLAATSGYATRVHEFSHFLEREQISAVETDRALRQFALESLALTSTDEAGFMSPRAGAKEGESGADAVGEGLFWDDPYSFLKPAGYARKRPPAPAAKSDVLDTSHKSVADAVSGSDARPEAAAGTLQRSSSLPATPRADQRASRSQTPLPQARPGSGILKGSRSRSASAKSRRSSSVKFDPDAIEKSARDLENEMAGAAAAAAAPVEERSPLETQSAEELLGALVRQQRRNLDEWCFAERLASPVLLQRLRAAAFETRATDTYYHRRDRSLAIVLHNPRSDAGAVVTRHGSVGACNSLSHEPWSCWLHADVGFRNYLENVAEKIADWTKAEEAKYQAELLRKELERQKELEAAAAAAAAEAAELEAKGKGGAKKGAKDDKAKKAAKGKASATPPKGGSRASSVERSSGDEEFLLRDESIKAQRKRQEQERIEREEAERAKAEAKASPRKGSARKAAAGSGPGTAREDTNAKRPGSGRSRSPHSPRSKSPRSGRASEMGGSPAPGPAAGAPAGAPAKAERFWPFSGYDVGDHLPHIGGALMSLYPSDGGIVRCDRFAFVDGTSLQRTSLLKDEHVFTVHLRDPIAPPDEAATANAPLDTPRDSQPISYFGSFTAELNDGVHLALSHYGASGEPPNATRRRPETPAYLREPSVGGTGTKAGNSAAGTPTPKGKRVKGGAEDAGAASGAEDDGGRDSKHAKQKSGVAASHAPGAGESDTPRALGSAALELEQLASARALKTPGTLYLSAPNGVGVTVEEDVEASSDWHSSFPPSGRSDAHFESSSLDELFGGLASNCRVVYKLSSPQLTQPLPTPASATHIERVRFVKGDGSVTRLFSDGTLDLLLPDGSHILRCDYAYLTTNTNVLKPGTKLPQSVQQMLGLAGASERSGRRAVQRKQKSGTGGEDAKGASKATFWVRTDASGHRTVSVEDGDALGSGNSNLCVSLEATQLAPVYASDPSTGQVMCTREDGTTILYSRSAAANKRFFVVEFADGTRITTEVRRAQSNLLARDQDTGEFTSPLSSERRPAVERVVTVEHPKLPRVSFNHANATSGVRFASGTEVHTVLRLVPKLQPSAQPPVEASSSASAAPADVSGAPGAEAAPEVGGEWLLIYQVQTANGGQLVIDSAAAVQYIPRVSPVVGYLQRRTCAYTMRHDSELVFEAEDEAQNLFQVTATGLCSVSPLRPSSTASATSLAAPDRLLAASGAFQQPAAESARQASARAEQAVAVYKHHRPQLFFLHEDGTGVELLRYADVAEFLDEAERDREAAVVRETVSGSLAANCLTLLRPYRHAIGDRWRSPYALETLIPPGLRARDMRLVPPEERTDVFLEHLLAEATDAPPADGRRAPNGNARGGARKGQLGHKMGRGLYVQTPSTILLAEQERYRLLQKRTRRLPAAMELRQLLQFVPLGDEMRIKVLSATRAYLEHMKQRECSRAEFRMREVRSQAEAQAQEAANESRVLPVAASIGAVLNAKLATVQGAGAAQTYARGLDKRVVSSQRAPTPGSSARAEEQPPATRSGKLESLQLELQEANAHREALARNLVPNYFSFPLGKEMILSQAVDLHRLAEQLGVFAQRGEPHSPLAAQIVGEAASARKSAKASAKDKTPKQKTPAAQLAASSRDSSGRRAEAVVVATSNGDEPRERWAEPPPTDGRAEPLPPVDASSIAAGAPAKQHPASLSLDASGSPRRGLVPLPSYLAAGRPNPLPNVKYMSVEEPVRGMQLQMGSVIGVPTAARVRQLRGLELNPQEVDMGPVVAGRTYAARVLVRNVGIDTAHVRIIPPRDEAARAQLRLRYTPTSLPAGLALALQLEFSPAAPAAGAAPNNAVQSFVADVGVLNEAELLTLRVRASVLSPAAYAQLQPPPLPAAGVKCLPAGAEANAESTLH